MQSPAPRRERGVTTTDTPLTIRRGRAAVPDPLRTHIGTRLGRQLGKFARQIEHVRVRFADVNGPRGGADKACSIQVVLSRLPMVVVEERGESDASAFDLSASRCERAVRRALDQKQGVLPRTPKASRGAASGRGKSTTPSRSSAAAGSIIGRRVGRAASNLEAALERPEKVRRDAVVDTSLPGASASDRKAGGGSTARRNAKRDMSGMTATLEDSASGTPSRKSSRRSANHAKQGTSLTRRQRAATATPKARATRGG